MLVASGKSGEGAQRRAKKLTLAKRAMARIMSVDLSITITAPVPNPD